MSTMTSLHLDENFVPMQLPMSNFIVSESWTSTFVANFSQMERASCSA